MRKRGKIKFHVYWQVHPQKKKKKRKFTGKLNRNCVCLNAFFFGPTFHLSFKVGKLPIRCLEVRLIHGKLNAKRLPTSQ